MALQAPANAHMAMKGTGEIASGALHPLVTPPHAMVLLGLGLLLGQRVPLDLSVAMVVFSFVSATALALTAMMGIDGIHQPLVIGIAMGVAGLVVLGRKFPGWVYPVTCALAAAGVGLDSGLTGSSTFDTAKTLLGTWLSINFIFAYVALVASNGADKQWAKIAIRVLGSWIVAISFLVLAFSFRK